MRAVLALKYFSTLLKSWSQTRTKLRFCESLVFAFCIFCYLQGFTQDEKSYKVTPLPLVFYTPETKFAFGGACILTFQTGENVLDSEVQLGAAYTVLNQVLLYAPYQVFTPNYRFEGELGYYKYTYKFFGIGNNIPFSYQENYDITYPRLRFSAYQKIHPSIWAGVAVASDLNKILAIEEGKKLETENISGASGAKYLGVGPALIYDTRDNNFYPSQGVLANLSVLAYPKFSGSFQAFRKLLFSVSGYKKVVRNGILAGQIGFEQNWGDVPFLQMAGLGGGKVLRGYYADRFRDLANTYFQTEFRFMPKRFGFTLFANVGWVGNTPGEFAINNAISAVGSGLRYRLQKNRKLNIRLDAGYGTKGVWNFYFTVLEAF